MIALLLQQDGRCTKAVAASKRLFCSSGHSIEQTKAVGPTSSTERAFVSDVLLVSASLLVSAVLSLIVRCYRLIAVCSL